MTLERFFTIYRLELEDRVCYTPVEEHGGGLVW
jgi:hypothetical protein